jgi:hypothetical protein
MGFSPREVGENAYFCWRKGDESIKMALWINNVVFDYSGPDKDKWWSVIRKYHRKIACNIFAFRKDMDAEKEHDQHGYCFYYSTNHSDQTVLNIAVSDQVRADIKHTLGIFSKNKCQVVLCSKDEITRSIARREARKARVKIVIPEAPEELEVIIKASSNVVGFHKESSAK